MATEAPNQENSTAQDAERPFVERLVICLRWVWNWHGFWSSWANEAEGVRHMFWMALVGFFAGVMQALFVLVYPAWRLLVEPAWTAFKLDTKTTENMQKILDR